MCKNLATLHYIRELLVYFPSDFALAYNHLLLFLRIGLLADFKVSLQTSLMDRALTRSGTCTSTHINKN